MSMPTNKSEPVGPVIQALRNQLVIMQALSQLLPTLNPFQPVIDEETAKTRLCLDQLRLEESCEPECGHGLVRL